MADAAEDVSDTCRIRSTPNLSRAGWRSRLPKTAIRSARFFPISPSPTCLLGKEQLRTDFGKAYDPDACQRGR